MPYVTPDYSQFIQNSLSTLADPFIQGMRERERRSALGEARTSTGEYDYGKAVDRLLRIGDVETAGRVAQISNVFGGTVSPETAERLLGGGGQPQPQLQRPSAVTVPPVFQPMIDAAAVQYGVPPEIIARQLGRESNFRPDAIGPVTRTGERAQGIAQFMPATAQERGVEPMKPESAIPGAASYLADLTKMFGGNQALGLAAYNWGPGNVQRWLSVGADPNRMPAETRKYVESITGQPIDAQLRPTPSEAGAAVRPGPDRAEIIRLLRSPYIADKRLGQKMFEEFVQPKAPFEHKEGVTLRDPRTLRELIPGQAKFTDELQLRKEFETNSKTHLTVRQAYERLLVSRDNAPGDISLIFSYMRMLDPNSVVREGEFATAQNAAGIPDIVRNLYNRALEGTRLNPDQRMAFKQQGKAIYDVSATEYKAREKHYRQIAKRRGINPDDIIPDIGPGPEALPGPEGPAKPVPEIGEEVPGMPGVIYRGKK